MTNDLIQNDTPVEIYGYKTDPLRRGYQILWNYESTYWAALVGNNDAWRLYEVLRSFCHEKNPTCTPSINLLLAVLAIKDRTVLIGRVKRTKEKDYQYPGLIDILQTHGLAIAEVKGHGPEMRYTFHINLTPGRLTPGQLAELPPVLQQKHKELLQRCEQASQELEAKKKPSKVQNDTQIGIGNFQEGVLEIPRGGIGNSYPNNTNTTVPHKNNNSGGAAAPVKDVVVALIKWGITEKVAQVLANNHPEDEIYKQIGFHEFEMATYPHKIKSPSGRLRTRIEENWTPDDRYTPDWQERLAAEKAKAEQARQNREGLAASLMTEKGTKRQQQEQLRQEHLEAVKRHYGASETHEKIWSNVKSAMLGRVGEVEYKTFIAGSELLAGDNHRATIWVRHSFLAQAIEKRYGAVVKKLLAEHLHSNPDDLKIEWVYPPTSQANGDLGSG